MAVIFASNGYLSTTNVPASQNIFSGTFTFAIWVNGSDFTNGTLMSPSNDGPAIMGGVGSVTSGSSYQDGSMMSLFAGQWNADCSIGFYSSEQGCSQNAGINAPLNTWIHLCVTRDGSTGTYAMYENGQPTATLFTFGSSFSTSVTWARLIVGGFAGAVQDAWMFTRVLSAAEVAALWAGRTERVSTSSLVAHWPLYADNPGLDISGNGRTLTATGSVTGSTLNAPTSQWYPGSTRALRTLAVSTGSTITGTASTASSATAAVSFAQIIPINATSTTASSAAATVSIKQAITASATTASSAAAAMLANIPITVASTTASSAAATVGLGLAISAAGQTASSATAAVSISTSTNITAAATTASSATATVSVNQTITAAATTASSATAAVSFAQVIPITAAAQTASSAAASFGSVGFQLTAAAQTASSAQGAIGSLVQATGTTASSAAASFTSASFPLAAIGTTASFATATMTSSGGGGGGGVADGDASGWRRWVSVGARRRIRR